MDFFGSSFGEIFSKLRKSKAFYGLALGFILLAALGFLPQVPLA